MMLFDDDTRATLCAEAPHALAYEPGLKKLELPEYVHERKIQIKAKPRKTTEPIKSFQSLQESLRSAVELVSDSLRKQQLELRDRLMQRALCKSLQIATKSLVKLRTKRAGDTIISPNLSKGKRSPLRLICSLTLAHAK